MPKFGRQLPVLVSRGLLRHQLSAGGSLPFDGRTLQKWRNLYCFLWCGSFLPVRLPQRLGRSKLHHQGNYKSVYFKSDAGMIFWNKNLVVSSSGWRGPDCGPRRGWHALHCYCWRAGLPHHGEEKEEVRGQIQAGLSRADLAQTAAGQHHQTAAGREADLGPFGIFALWYKLVNRMLGFGFFLHQHVKDWSHEFQNYDCIFCWDWAVHKLI